MKKMLAAEDKKTAETKAHIDAAVAKAKVESVNQTPA